MDNKCSVIIPVYNSERFIAETVESVLSQTVREIEIIVVDDCSTDSSFEILQKLSNRDDRIRVYKNEKNCGVALTRNKGIELSSGKYIALLDSDDVWMPDKLEKQLNFFKLKDCKISYCSYGFIDMTGNNLGADFIVPPSVNLAKLLSRSVISCSTVIAEKELFLKHKFKNEYYHEDFVLWIDMLKDCKISYGLTDVLTNLRIMRDSRSGNKVNSAKQRWIVYRKYLDLNTVYSLYHYLLYIFFGLKKYRRLRKVL